VFRLLNKKVYVSWIVNPFFLYCIGFSFAAFLYIWNWSNLYPRLSFELIRFLVISFLPFIVFGYIFFRKGYFQYDRNLKISFPDSLLFIVILILGSINIAFGGVLPILNNGLNYKVFGLPILNAIFNTLCIFSSVLFFYSYLESKKIKLLFFILIIIIIQVLLFRRSTIVWIITSLFFLYIKRIEKLPAYSLFIFIILIYVGSFCFGFFGNKRNNYSRTDILSEFNASSSFKKLKISHNHYMTYLYISSPLANLQKNINESKGFQNNDSKDFIFYSFLPQSLTRRLEKNLSLTAPSCSLISPDLIVGSYFMTGFKTFGWLGMVLLVTWLIIFILAVILVIPRNSPFYMISFVLLCTTISMLIFDNMLTRSDVILMIFGYPIIFYQINKLYMSTEFNFHLF
jgi:hypothetical protein